MLWLKSWTEVRFRFALTIFLGVYILAILLGYLPPQMAVKLKTLSSQDLGKRIWEIFVLAYGGAMLPVSAKILAGAGINAQTSMGMSHGFHGSMSFLLSMPVSRTRLMATRASFGAALMLLLALATFAATVTLAPSFHVDFSSINVWAYFPNMLVVGYFFYAMAVWLSTIFDEFWAGTIGLLILGMLGGYSSTTPHNWLDFATYLLSPDPLQPLGQTLFLLMASAVQIEAARWVVEHKEY